MGDDTDGRHSAVETLVAILVLADIPIIVVAVMVGPLYGVALAAIFVFGGLLAWYLGRRLDGPADGSADTETGPVTELKRRYAAGELSDAEFERRVDRLVETDSRTDHPASHGSATDATPTETDDPPNAETDSFPSDPVRDGDPSRDAVD